MNATRQAADYFPAGHKFHGLLRLESIAVDMHQTVDVIGDPDMGWYEWVHVDVGGVREHSDSGYGSIEIALRDGLVKVLGPLEANAERESARKLGAISYPRSRQLSAHKPDAEVRTAPVMSYVDAFDATVAIKPGDAKMYACVKAEMLTTLSRILVDATHGNFDLDEGDVNVLVMTINAVAQDIDALIPFVASDAANAAKAGAQ